MWLISERHRQAL
ncbi:uncharacterized protein FFC1_06630 [Fusarium fujikuroi]|nr:uncharacterized protein FFC1_06630 [Fusarium fujikuroi]